MSLCGNSYRTLPSVLTLALLACSWTVQAQGQPPLVRPLPPAPATPGDGRPCVPDARDPQKVVERGDGNLFRPTGDVDRDFAVMMRAHHLEGVDMAKRLIADGRSTRLKAMARRIVKDRQREILELEAWSARHNVRVSRGDSP